jgi:hypothetical protein
MALTTTSSCNIIVYTDVVELNAELEQESISSTGKEAATSAKQAG